MIVFVGEPSICSLHFNLGS